MTEYYYNFDIKCDIYVLGGVVDTDVEYYAESFDDLCDQVYESFENDYDYDLDEIGGIYLEVNYTNDPAYKGTDQYMYEEEE